MFNTVKAEMARKNMTIVELSNATGIKYGALADKIRGDSPMSVAEAIKIKGALDVDMSYEELFQEG